MDPVMALTRNKARAWTATLALFLLLPLSLAPAQERANAGKDLHGHNFSNQKLMYANFSNSNLEEADFSFANLSNANMKNAKLKGANLESARLADADLTGADLRDAKIMNANFHNAKLIRAILNGQTFYLAGSAVFLKDFKDKEYEVKQAIIESSDRNNGFLSFQGADLRYAVIVGNLEGVDFRRADLRGADLSKSENLSQAILRGAVYDSSTRWNIDPIDVGAILSKDSP
jgi:uncharacterized protein YjbI with pentapeptide repeats